MIINRQCTVVADDGAQGGDQERRHGGGHAAGRRGLRHPVHREVQHREGHRPPHQVRVRQEVQPHLALRRGAQLWQLRDPRDEALHLFLLGSGRHPALQIGMSCVTDTHRETGGGGGGGGGVERGGERERGGGESGRVSQTENEKKRRVFMFQCILNKGGSHKLTIISYARLLR